MGSKRLPEDYDAQARATPEDLAVISQIQGMMEKPKGPDMPEQNIALQPREQQPVAPQPAPQMINQAMQAPMAMAQPAMADAVNQAAQQAGQIARERAAAEQANQARGAKFQRATQRPQAGMNAIGQMQERPRGRKFSPAERPSARNMSTPGGIIGSAAINAAQELPNKYGINPRATNSARMFGASRPAPMRRRGKR